MKTWEGKGGERGGLSSVPEEITTSQRKQVTVFFLFFFLNYVHLTYLHYVHILHIYNMYIFTYIQYLLISGSGGAPVGQPPQVPGGGALSQPMQHPSNRTG